MKHIYLMVIAMAVSLAMTAQEIERPDSYNYTRGMEAVQNENYDEGIEFLQKELKENPKNGYAYGWLAIGHLSRGEYGMALTTINQSVKLIPKKDKEWKAYSYALRSAINQCLGDTLKALEDYAMAIDLTPDNTELYDERGQLYYATGQYELSDKDYQKICELDPGGVVGYMGLGRNDEARGDYEEAIKHFDYVIKLDSDYSSGYSFRAASLVKLKHYDKAVDDIIKALEINKDDMAFSLMVEIADPAFTQLISKLKIQCVKNPNSDYWPYCLAGIYREKEQYKLALEQFKISFEKEGNSTPAYFASQCCCGLEDYQSALKYIDYAIESDSSVNAYFMQKANILYELGQTEQATRQIGVYISRMPEYGIGYYRRGFFKGNAQDYDGAIEDYTMAIALDPDHAYPYLRRGDMYLAKGQKELAMADYRKVVEIDTVPGNSSRAQYAFLGLGQKEKAIDFMNRIIEQDKENKDNYYDKACLYSRMGEKEEALKALKISLEKGFRLFKQIENDEDLDGIRNLPEFKALIEEYRKIHEKEVTSEEDVVYVEKTAEVPFVKEGEMCNVKCSINGLPLHFIFDTGASDVSMSSVEATFMFKNGYLKQQDVQGKQNFITADGNISEGTVVNLRNVEFGGLKLNNINASIVKNQRAPLLLGQSVLKRLGRIEIDNAKRVMKITYKERK